MELVGLECQFELFQASGIVTTNAPSTTSTERPTKTYDDSQPKTKYNQLTTAHIEGRGTHILYVASRHLSQFVWLSGPCRNEPNRYRRITYTGHSALQGQTLACRGPPFPGHRDLRLRFGQGQKPPWSPAWSKNLGELGIFQSPSRPKSIDTRAVETAGVPA